MQENENGDQEESKQPTKPVAQNQAAASQVAFQQSEDAGELIDSFGRMMGKNFSTLKNKLRDEDISTVSELAALSEAELTDLGFTIGLKKKLKTFLSER